ncbi:putative O-acetylserine (thiol) lyase 2, partial [Toxoplasma gondii FOU]
YAICKEAVEHFFLERGRTALSSSARGSETRDECHHGGDTCGICASARCGKNRERTRKRHLRSWKQAV